MAPRHDGFIVQFMYVPGDEFLSEDILLTGICSRGFLFYLLIILL